MATETPTRTTLPARRQPKLFGSRTALTFLFAPFVVTLTGIVVVAIIFMQSGWLLESSVSMSDRPLTELGTRWMEMRLRVPRVYDNGGFWRATVASVTLKQQNDRVGGCWDLRLIINTTQVASEKTWELVGPYCEQPGMP